MTRAQTQQTLRQLPVKWALALLGLIVVYAVAQPTLNSRFGWGLPSLASLMGETEQKKSPTEEKAKVAKQTKSKSDSDSDSPKASESKSEVENSKPLPETQTKSEAAAQSSSQTKTKAASGNSTLRYGVLKETSRDRYVSVEGLQYNPGSAEGHRLKHLERHLKDIPDRPGKHGVFDGEIADALKWIDEAYARGKSGATGVRKTQEDDRTIYEVPFTQRIGFVGGRDGQRAGHPPAKRLRLVVEGKNFITAFPFDK